MLRPNPSRELGRKKRIKNFFNIYICKTTTCVSYFETSIVVLYRLKIGGETMLNRNIISRHRSND